MRGLRTASFGRLAATTLAASCAALCPRVALAVDPFEIQVYDGTADAPGEYSAELHANRVFSGLTTATPPELPPNHQTHLTLEAALGVLPWFEPGAYVQTAILADGTFRYAGIKLRGKFVTPPGTFEYVRLGLNIEVSYLPEDFDPEHFGTELRPIAAFENDLTLLAINPIVGVTYSGDDAGLFLEPAAMAKLKLLGAVAFGIEYYSDLGPLFTFEPWEEQEHYLYEAVDLIAWPRLEVNVAVGQGLTDASNDFVGKMILGYTFGEARGPAKLKASRQPEPH